MTRYIITVLLVLSLTGVTGIAQNTFQRELACQDAGSTDTYACDLPVLPTAYVTGRLYIFKANTANTAAASINFSSLGAKIIKKTVNGTKTDLVTGDIGAGQWVVLTYDGTDMQMQSPPGTSAEGGGGGSTFTLLHSAVDQIIVGTSTTGQIVYTYTVGAGALTTGDQLQLRAFVCRTAGTDAVNLETLFGTGGLWPGYGVTLTACIQYNVDWDIRSSTSAVGSGFLVSRTGVANFDTGDLGADATINTASTNVLTIRVDADQFITSATTFKLIYFKVYRFRL